MPVLNQNQKNSNPIISSAIRTMKKDLKRLREADVVRESRKIIDLAPAQPKKAAPVPVQPAAAPTPRAVMPPTTTEVKHVSHVEIEKPLQTPLQQHTEAEQKAMQEAKQYATEAERQQMFLLETELKNLHNSLSLAAKEQEPPLALEKNDILLGQEKWQKALRPIMEQEAVMEEKQKALEQKESQNVTPEQKQALEKERWTVENELQETEKKRWAVEKELAALNERIVALNENYAALNSKKKMILENIAQTDAKLRDIYQAVIEREKTRRKNAVHDEAKKSYDEIGLKRKEEQHQQVKELQNSQKEYVRQASQAARENVAASAKKEEEQRKKFMEDIEAWEAANKQQGE